MKRAIVRRNGCTRLFALDRATARDAAQRELGIERQRERRVARHDVEGVDPGRPFASPRDDDGGDAAAAEMEDERRGIVDVPLLPRRLCEQHR